MKNKLLVFCLCLFTSQIKAQFDLLWTNTAGASTNDIAFSVTSDFNGDIIATGFFNGTVDFDPGPATFNLTGQGSNDIFLAKYNSSGSLVWAFALGSADSEFGNVVKTDAIGNIYLSISFADVLDLDPGPGIASFTSIGFTANSILAKYDPNGNYLWGIQIASTTSSSINGMSFDNTNNVLITGTFYGTVDFDPGVGTLNLVSAGSSDIFFAKYNSSGQALFAKNIGGADLDAGFQITSDNTGNILVTGGFRTSADFDPGPGLSVLNTAGVSSLTDLFFAKYDANGNYIWAKSIGGSDSEIPGGIVVDNSNNIVVFGTIRNLVDFDPGSGTVILGPTPAGGEDFFTAGFNPNGDYLWAQVSGGTGVDIGTIIAKNSENEFYITGRFSGTIDFDPGPGLYSLTSTGIQNGFFARYTMSGQFLNAARLGGSGSTEVEELAVINGDTIVIVGQFSAITDFNPGTGTDNRNANGGSDLFIGKYAVSQSSLPIILRDFRFDCRTTGIQLSWTTDQETNFLEFILERSTDGYRFKAIDTIKAAGNSITANGYSIFDQQNLQDKRTFYRLKQVDQDMQYSYSRVIAASCSVTNSVVKIFPNPASEIITIFAPSLSAASVSIIGLDGKELMHKLVNQPGPSFSLNISNLPKGMYILAIRSGLDIFHHKFIK
jgi:Secretion system C-terminal sorting domain